MRASCGTSVCPVERSRCDASLAGKQISNRLRGFADTSVRSTVRTVSGLNPRSTFVMTAVMFDKQDQYDKIAANLLNGESILAVYDAIGAGTGFIGLTSLRVIIQDNSF